MQKWKTKKDDTNKRQDKLGTSCSARKQISAQRMTGVKGTGGSMKRLQQNAKPRTNRSLGGSNESNYFIKTH